MKLSISHHCGFLDFLRPESTRCEIKLRRDKMQAKFCEGLENRATSEFNRMQKHDWENVCSLFAKVHSSFDFQVIKCDKK